MTKLLWLCTIALGVRMLQEQTYELPFRWMIRTRRILRWVSLIWLVALVVIAIWWSQEF